MAPIHRCPEDVLLMVFCSFAGGNPESATRLLSVCRRWYDIVVRAPRLWNHIDVKLRKDWNLSTATDLFIQHITTCLQRSASLRLHIRLDLDGLLTKQIEHRVRAMIEAIPVLVGENGEHMKRWETFEIILPSYPDEGDSEDESEDEYTTDESIWRHFSYPAPNLNQLWVKNAYFVQDIPPHSQLTSFLQLESLKYLRIAGGPRKWDFLGLNFESVTRLELDSFTESYIRVLSLSKFTRLQHLLIGVFQEVVVIGSLGADAVIHLPSLQTLSIKYYSPTSIIWDLPLLQMLTIDGYHGRLTGFELPKVLVLHVCWRTYYRHQKKDFEIQQHLRLLLSQYTEMRKLTIPSIARPVWEGDWVTELRGSRALKVEFIEEE